VIHIDTCFATDLLRELKRDTPGPATKYLSDHADDTFSASIFVACELESGVHASNDPVRERAVVDRMLNSLSIVYPKVGFSEVYASQYAKLKSAGVTVHTMDLLIAVTSLCSKASILTRNVKHFERIEDLKINTY